MPVLVGKTKLALLDIKVFCVLNVLVITKNKQNIIPRRFKLVMFKCGSLK